MKKEHVIDIMDSDENLEVTYRGISVWIEKVDNNEAKVKILESGEEIGVPFSELHESGRELK